MESICLKNLPLIVLGHDPFAGKTLSQSQSAIASLIKKQLRDLFSNAVTICGLDKADQFVLSRLLAYELIDNSDGTILLSNERNKTSESYGKPFFESTIQSEKNSLAHPIVSISHRAQFALVGIGNHDLGVDLEVVETQKDLAFEKASLTPNEQEWLNSLDDGDRSIGQMALWTAKESVSKAFGTGLQISPQDIEISYLECISFAWTRFQARIHRKIPFSGESRLLNWKDTLLVASLSQSDFTLNPEVTNVVV